MKMIEHACIDTNYVFTEVFCVHAGIRVKTPYVSGHAHMSLYMSKRAGPVVGPWPGTVVARHEHGTARLEACPGRPGSIAVPGLGWPSGPRCRHGPGTVNW
jgi:hypothetical protein